MFNRLLQILCACTIVAVCLEFAQAKQAWAWDAPQPTLQIDLTAAGLYPYQSDMTPIFHSTAQGQLVLIPGYGSLGKPAHALISDDQGRSWQNWDGFDAWPEMAYADVIRRGNELLAFGHNSNWGYTGTYLWRSSDEGLTWTGGERLTSDTDPWAPMNQRVLLDSNGRLIVPVEQLLGDEGSGANQIGTIYSDDGGQSWTRSAIFGPPSSLPDRPEGFGEPSVVELADGKQWMVYRTRYGRLWQAWSDDDGATWGQPSPTSMVSPLSSVIAKRIPGTDKVITIWNNAAPGTSENWNDYPNLWTPRSPLVFVTSGNNCQSWSRPVVVDSGTAAYPSVYFSGNEMFLSYWEDPNPNATFLNPNSHLKVVAYDINKLYDPRPYSPEPTQVMGTEWNFNSGDYSPTFGKNVMSDWGTMDSNRLFGTSTGFGGPEVPGTTGKSVWVTQGGMRSTDGLAISTGGANGGYGAKVNQYTLIMDVMSVGGAQYRSLYNTNPDNATDGRFARYPDGTIGYWTTGGTMLQDPLTWYRIAVTVDAGANSVNHYIDGILVNTEPTDKVALDGIYSAAANSRLLLFADDNVDLGSWFLSCVYYVNRTLSASEIAALGGPNGNGIYVNVIAGDANYDFTVDAIDAAIIAANWQGTEKSWTDGDFNGDGKVDDFDAALLAANWQSTPSQASASVPEPGTFVLLSICLLCSAFFLRRRHPIRLSGGSLVPQTLFTFFLACLCFCCTVEAQTKNEIQPSFRLNLSKQYRLDVWQGDNAPVFHRTAKGDIVLLPGQFSLGKPPHALVSSDEGRTWRNWESFQTWPKIVYADVIRLGKELLTFGHTDADVYKGTYLWRSCDEGATWTEGNRLTPDTDRYAPMNQRILVSGRGRLIVPVELLLGSEGGGPNHIGTVVSDDEGKTWQRGRMFGPPPPLPDRPEGFGEPSIVELNDGRFWMVFRTRFGHLWQAWSSDGGLSWGKPTSTGLDSPLTAVAAKRIPGSDAVVMVWNNVKPAGTNAVFASDANSFWWPRSPLMLAVSRDECKTWCRPTIVDAGAAAQASIFFSDKEMFLCYSADPDPKANFISPNSSLILVVYDLQLLLRAADK